jgi:hypothetical protein
MLALKDFKVEVKKQKQMFFEDLIKKNSLKTRM